MTFKSFTPDSYNWIVGTSYRIGEKEFRVVWNDYQALGLLKYCKKSYSQHQGDMHIDTPWGSKILCVSADNADSLLGEGLSHAIMCEAAKHNRSTWEQYIEPALSDFRGSCDFPSTPQGYNWYHGLWLMGQEGALFDNNPQIDQTLNRAGLSQYQSWQFPTWENKVRFPGGRNDPEIQRVYRTVSPHWFDQEYGAEFTSLSGAIYEEWNPKIHILDSYEYNPKWDNYLAFDYGFKNAFVCLDIQVTPSDDVIVWREYYVSQRSTLEHARFLKDRANPKDYHIAQMWGDPRGADEAATLLSAGFGPVLSHDVRWKLSVEQIKRMLSTNPPKLHSTPDTPHFNRQMAKLHVKEQGKQARMDLQEQQGDGNIQHKIDDHACDALRYFIGPHFVTGAGLHLADVYGENYQGSESEDFIQARLDSHIKLDDVFSLLR